MAAAQPVSAQVVGNAFVQQYYHILHHSPGLVHRFYQDSSKLGRPEDDGSMSITTTMQAINEKILSLNYADIRAEIQFVDAQESLNGGVHVLVTGYWTEKDSMIRNFTQAFFLAPQDRGYFVLNDMFRYVGNSTKHTANSAPANDVMAPVTLEQNHPPIVENHISEQIIPLVEAANGGEVYDPPEDREVPVVVEEVPVVEEEMPVAEVVDEVQDGPQMVVRSDTKIVEVPKKSYASIVMHLKDSAATFSPPPPAPRKPIPKAQEQVNQSSASATDGLGSSSDADQSGNHEGEAPDGYSIYIKGLPANATASMLHEEFKKFGPIKNGGIQVRRNRLQEFCFGFVEFEAASAVEKALEASPIAIGESQVIVEEKRSTNSRVNANRGRFLPGRGSGFRNEGMRGRGNYGGGRGYSRNDFGGRNEFSNRGSNQGGSSNRSDGFQRVEKVTDNGRRMNHPAGMANGNARNLAPRVSATA